VEQKMDVGGIDMNDRQREIDKIIQQTKEEMDKAEELAKNLTPQNQIDLLLNKIIGGVVDG